MKKWFIIIILSVFIIPISSAKGIVILCQYEGYIGGNAWNMGGENPKEHAYIGIQGHDFYIDVPTYLNLDSYAGYDPGFGPYQFMLSETMESAQRANQVMFSSKSWTPVTWKNSSEMYDLVEKGKCPSVISFGCDNDLCFQAFDSDNDIEFIIGEAQSNSYDDAERMQFPVPRYSNYYPDVDSGYPLFSDERYATYNQLSQTCITDSEQIDKIITWFDMSYNTAASKVEKSVLADFYAANGYDDIANNFIKNYKPGSECYENNPSMQGKFDDLIDACTGFLELIDKDTDVYDVSTCDQIIGTGTFAYYLNQTFRFIQYLGPIIVIVLSTIEYIKVAALSDADQLKKTNKRTITRLIFALLLFFIPMIIKIILNIFGFYGDCLDSIL